MESQRQKKIAGVIQKDLAEIFQRELSGTFSKTPMITVTRVVVSKDLSIAKVAVSLFAIDDKEAFLEEIKANASEIRYLLGKRIRHQLRIVPELHFYLDDSLDYIEHIDNLLKE
jgi:ribosome-binding factor A